MHFISSTWLLLILLIPKEAERLCLGFFYRSSSCLFRLSALVCIVINYFLPPSCVLKKVWRKNILLFSTKIDALKGYSNNAVSLLYCHLSHKDFETEMHTFFFSSFFFLCFFVFLLVQLTTFMDMLCLKVNTLVLQAPHLKFGASSKTFQSVMPNLL